MRIGIGLHVGLLREIGMSRRHIKIEYNSGNLPKLPFFNAFGELGSRLRQENPSSPQSNHHVPHIKS